MAAVDLQYTSDTQYSDDDGSEEEEEDDDISVCSGSTISAGGQSTISDLVGSGFDDAYCDGTHHCRVYALHCIETNCDCSHCHICPLILTMQQQHQQCHAAVLLCNFSRVAQYLQKLIGLCFLQSILHSYAI